MFPFNIAAAQALVLALIVPSTLGLSIPIQPRDDKKVIALDFNVTPPQGTNFTFNGDSLSLLVDGNSKLKVANSPISVPIHGSGGSYIIELLIGSSKNKVTVALDTGSSDLNVVDSNLYCGDNLDCHANGLYDPSSSTTSQNLNIPVDLEYGSGASTGTYYKDDVSLGEASGVTVKGLQFADITDSEGASGILGIGYEANEAARQEYPNFVSLLKSQNYINKRAYSLYLNSVNAQTGTILFGGKDTRKYKGKLTTYLTSGNERLQIPLQLLSVGGQSVSLSGSNGVLDSGTTLRKKKKEEYYQLAAKLNWIDVSSSAQQPPGNYYAGPCSGPDFVFNFGNGGTVTVPYSAVTMSVTDDNSLCIITVLPNTNPKIEGITILGDNFLRSAYVVYDLDAEQISIANVNYTTDSNVVEL